MANFHFNEMLNMEPLMGGGFSTNISMHAKQLIPRNFQHLFKFWSERFKFRVTIKETNNI